ncbi:MULTISPECIES: hypothetical protein [Streptomyces]|uniref:hypothetical protein n=1 Tax=Streptomyces TaxID=1883 RepID=UPI0029319C3D|nr:hypothetical protein [Streptomyces sp. NEAU-HV9]
MARRILTLTTVTTTAALLLTACGGGGGDKSDDIKGADTGSKSPSASAPASSSAPSGAKRPVITLPSSFQLTFENWTSGDPVKQAVLNDAKEELRAGYAAIIADNPDSEAVAFYDTAGVVQQTKTWIKSYTDKNLTVIGKLPAFSPRVSLAKTGAGASLSYCTDESKASTKNRKTSKVEGNPAGTNPYVLYTVSLAKSAQGVWQNSSVHSERGGCSK